MEGICGVFGGCGVRGFVYVGLRIVLIIDWFVRIVFWWERLEDLWKIVDILKGFNDFVVVFDVWL